MATKKFRVHVLMSIVVEALDAGRAKDIANSEMFKGAKNEEGQRPTLRVVSVWDAEEKEDRR